MLAMYHSCLFLGAGIYVWWSNGSPVNGPQPSNSYALVDVGIGFSSFRLTMDCCSNNTYPDASFTYPDGHVSAGSYWNSSVFRQTENNSHAGCYLFNLSHNYSFGSNGYDGIYTCNITDSRGTNLNINIGLYDEGFSSESSILNLNEHVQQACMPTCSSEKS